MPVNETSLASYKCSHNKGSLGYYKSVGLCIHNKKGVREMCVCIRRFRRSKEGREVLSQSREIWKMGMALHQGENWPWGKPQRVVDLAPNCEVYALGDKYIVFTKFWTSKEGACKSCTNKQGLKDAPLV